uniref:Uncharacterized protein n=1 Tax=Tanacetum cinerariifolium TaxID=118510 RepID=A0A6L2M0K3_TANCI|nr:hypothetical protein [Tanacetum cinerariifolium]
MKHLGIAKVLEPLAEEQDEQQQQNMLDVDLVPINEQVKIASSNFRIALEKTHPDVIYKVCMVILKQCSFYNALIATADAPEIYMKHFWYTITYDLNAKAYILTMSDQSIWQNLKDLHPSKLQAEVAEDVDSEETNEEPSVRRKPVGVVIGRELQNELDDEGLDHSKKLKGLETLSVGVQFRLNITKALKASKDDFYIQQRPQRGSGKGSGVTLEVTEKQASEEEQGDVQGGDGQSGDAQADVHKLEPLIENPEVILINPIEPEVQSMVVISVTQEKPAEPRPLLVDKTVTLILDATIISPSQPQTAQPKRNKIKMEKAAKKSMPKHSSTPFDQAALDEFEEKDKLFQMMRKSKSYNKHSAHKALYASLALSLNAEKKRKRKDSDALTLKKSKDKGKPLKGTKASSGPPPSKKALDDDDQLQDGAVDDSEMAQDTDFNTKEHPQRDAAPSQDRCPYDLRKPLPLQGPSGHLTILIEFFFNNDLEYLKNRNKERKYDASVTKTKAARCPYDLRKPLPLQGPSGHLTILIEFFFNNDLEYLKNRNKERKYDASVTKTKAARYNLKFIKDMID